ncbi:MFS transporter [Jatrophihabitans sp. YIM 134969]
MTATETPTATLASYRRGWYWYGWASHVFPTLITTVFMSRYMVSVTEEAVGENGRVHVLGIPLAPGSLFGVTLTTFTVVAVVLMPVVGAFADRTGRKRDIMCGLGAVGAVACMAMFFVRGGNWQLAVATYAVAFIAYSCAAVVNYALLVDLSNSEERDKISSVGWGVSYLGGGLLLAAAFVLSLFLDDDALLARLAMGASGVWWLVFLLPTLRRLPRTTHTSAERPDAGGSTFVEGFRQLGRTLASLRAFPLTLAFLVAFLVYNDGIQTVTTVAAVYGDKELGLDDQTLLPAILLVQFVAFGGALWLGRLAERFGAKRVVLASLVVWTGLVLVAFFVQRGSVWQFYALAIGIAIVLGGSQALSRSLFSRMIPAGKEAEYFGFYEISDSGTSWLGPLIFSVAYQTTGSYRSALVSLVVFFVVGFVLLAFVPVRRAIEASGNVAPEKV